MSGNRWLHTRRTPENRLAHKFYIDSNIISFPEFVGSTDTSRSSKLGIDLLPRRVFATGKIETLVTNWGNTFQDLTILYIKTYTVPCRASHNA